MFRSRLGQPSAGIEQILYDAGILLGWHHALPDLRVSLHHGQVHPDPDSEEEVHFLGHLQ